MLMSECLCRSAYKRLYGAVGLEAAPAGASEPLETLHQRPGSRQIPDVFPYRVLSARCFGQFDRVLIAELCGLRGQEAGGQVGWFGFGGRSVGAAGVAAGEAVEEGLAGLQDGQ